MLALSNIVQRHAPSLGKQQKVPRIQNFYRKLLQTLGVLYTREDKYLKDINQKLGIGLEL